MTKNQISGADAGAYTRGQEIETDILDLADGDRCFGRLPNGQALFVRGPVAVGDRVRAEIIKVKRNFAEARCLAVLSPSPHRQDPPCSHFGVCGGCKWQHVVYAEQLRIKTKQAEDALRHIGGFMEVRVRPTVPAQQLFQYRNKVEFSFARRRYLLPEEMGQAEAENVGAGFALGFHAPGLHDKVVSIDRCHIATEEMNQALTVVRRFGLDRRLIIYSTHTHDGFLRALVVRQSSATGEVMVNLVTSSYEEELMQALLRELQAALGTKLCTLVNNVTNRKNDAAIGDREVRVFGPGVITERVGGAQFKISANSFFQTNTAQAENLYAETLRLAALEPNQIVYDVYSGAGAIAILAAPRCRRVVGLELVESAIADARTNAELNQRVNCLFQQLDLKDLKKSLPELERQGLPDVIITDPPRAGNHPKALQVMLNLNPVRLVYVSCNPASLARDAKMIRESGRYRLDEVVPVDMFPHTNHIECVARFERVG